MDKETKTPMDKSTALIRATLGESHSITQVVKWLRATDNVLSQVDPQSESLLDHRANLERALGL